LRVQNKKYDEWQGGLRLSSKEMDVSNDKRNACLPRPRSGPGPAGRGLVTLTDTPKDFPISPDIFPMNYQEFGLP